MTRLHTHYDNLKVARDAPADVVKAAYRALTQRHHPDRNPGDAGAVRAMQAINDAYAVLSDPRQRRAYDAWLAAHGHAAGTGHAPRAVQPHVVSRSTDRSGTRRDPSAADGAPLPHDRASQRWLAAALLVVAGVLAATIALHRWRVPAAPAAIEAGADAQVPRWEMRGLDTPASPRQAPDTRTAAPAPIAQPPADQVPTPVEPMPALPPPVAATPGLPIVADPNGRPWPLAAGYVDGLPQEAFDGLATVDVDNRGNAWPAFVKLVALDQDRAVAVRHVYVPAMQAFRIENIRPGRYELRFRNLVTGEPSRSGEFTLRQVETRDSVHYSELDITLYRVPGGALGVLPLAASEF